MKSWIASKLAISNGIGGRTRRKAAPVCYHSRRLSASLSTNEKAPVYLQVLSSGFFPRFEILDRNSLEQLLINYANERLQQHFSRAAFLAERAEYAEEGISLASHPVSGNDDDGGAGVAR